MKKQRIEAGKITRLVGDETVLDKEASVYADMVGGLYAGMLFDEGLADYRGKAMSPFSAIDGLAAGDRTMYGTIVEYYKTQTLMSIILI